MRGLDYSFSNTYTVYECAHLLKWLCLVFANVVKIVYISLIIREKLSIILFYSSF